MNNSGVITGEALKVLTDAALDEYRAGLRAEVEALREKVVAEYRTKALGDEYATAAFCSALEMNRSILGLIHD